MSSLQDFVSFSESLNIACGRIADCEDITGEFTDAQLRATLEPSLEKRRRERATVYRLLNTIAPYGSLIRHTPSGQPLLYPDRQLYLSVSHSDTFAAVATAKFPVGVDIETISGRLSRIAPKFLSQSETNLLKILIQSHTGEKSTSATKEFGGNEDSEYRKLALLTAFWTAKEAIFKVTGADGLVISQIQLTCDPSTGKIPTAAAEKEFPCKDAILTLYSNVGADRYVARSTVIDEGKTCLSVAFQKKNAEKIEKNFPPIRI